MLTDHQGTTSWWSVLSQPAKLLQSLAPASKPPCGNLLLANRSCSSPQLAGSSGGVAAREGAGGGREPHGVRVLMVGVSIWYPFLQHLSRCLLPPLLISPEPLGPRLGEGTGGVWEQTWLFSQGLQGCLPPQGWQRTLPHPIPHPDWWVPLSTHPLWWWCGSEGRRKGEMGNHYRSIGIQCLFLPHLA